VAELFKTRFFAVIKRACGYAVAKYWLTGVLPAFRDGISPLSATDVISAQSEYHGLCGLTEAEVRSVVTACLPTFTDADLEDILARMKDWLGGYRFCPDGPGTSSLPLLYNPQLLFSHLRTITHGGISSMKKSTRRILRLF
jgi:hypothetical protein